MSDIKHMLLWCLALNYALLLIWFGLFACAHAWLYRLHQRWFTLSRESFDALNWAGIAFYKVAIILFNLVPLAALWLSAASG
jgi:uncharacterized protein DUF6868